MTRTDNSIKNIKFTLFFQIASVVVAFFTRRVFVSVLTKDYLGLSGTFSDILSVLSLAELGVGTAVIYSLYKPLLEGNSGQISAIMSLYKRVYAVIGIIVAGTGAALTPFLPYVIHDLPDIPYLNIIYLLFILNSSLAYFYTYKQSIITADQKQYVVTGWQRSMEMVIYGLQAVFLILTRNYFVYLGLQIGVTFLKNVILARYADKYYPYLKSKVKEKLEPETKSEIIRNIKALSIHNLGGVAVFGTDNLLTAYFFGLATVGMYSNYLMIVNSVKMLYDYLMRSVTASVGNFCASEKPEQVLPVFKNINFVVFWLIGFSAVCLAVLLNPFIKLWVGESYLFNEQIALVIAINFYVWGMRKAVLMFWNAYGLYWYGRYKPIAECAVNLIASIILAPYFGIAGILMGTIISTVTTCFWIEPTVLFKHVFKTSPAPYYKEYIINTLVSAAALVITQYVCSLIPAEGVLWFIVKAAVSIVLSNAVFALFFFRRSEFKYFVQLIKSRIKFKTQT